KMAFSYVLRRLPVRGITTHGFRSSFRDWAAERTGFPSEIAELALAHRVGSEVERAYRRSDLFEKRRALIREWEAYCDTRQPAGEVVPIRRRETGRAVT